MSPPTNKWRQTRTELPFNVEIVIDIIIRNKERNKGFTWEHVSFMNRFPLYTG